MARGRFISKEVSLDEKVDALSDDTCRLLFTWLITHLDCEGRMYGDAQTVKSIVFPRREISIKKVERYLQELEKLELISRYSVKGNQYLWMRNFEKHQVGLVKMKEAPSIIPPPEDWGEEAYKDWEGGLQSEKDIEDIIASNLEDKKWVFSFPLVEIKRQYRVENSYIDIYCQDEQNNKILIEVKKHRLSNKALSQLIDYQKIIGLPSYGILIGKEITPTLDEHQAREHNISIYTYYEGKLIPVILTNPICQINGILMSDSIVKSEVKVKDKVKDDTPKGGHHKALSTEQGKRDSIINEIFTEMRAFLGFPDKVDKDPIPSYGREGSAIKRMLTRGFTREAILECWKAKVLQRGGEFVSMTWANQDIGQGEKSKRWPEKLSTEAEIAASIKDAEL
jgi:hypothetical protein